MRRLVLLIAAILLMTTSVAMAQEGETPVQNVTTETVHISWPPPVTEVWGTGDVLGTAAVSGMAYYYLEYITLNDDLSIPQNAPWLPATVGITQPIVDGTLATLDTTTVPDGVYALRLTVNTQDGQSYHDMVLPIRVDNERFGAILAGTGQEETPEPAPTQAPQDTTARVVPSPQYTAINIRRCDLVDNDRCPVIAALRSGESALVQALSSNGSGWFQVQLPSGTVGWVSPTVVAQQGDFSGVGRTQPPAPLTPPARPVQLPDMAPVGQVSGVIPNGMAIEGNNATCNRNFNVQINVANTGNTVSPAGTVTLQDVNIRTGEITFTGYGNYPSLNPGANFVVVIAARTAIYFNEDHELRAYSNGRQFSLRYQLQQGDCGQSTPPPQQNQQAQRRFSSGECTIVVTDIGEVYRRPEGEVVFILDPGSYPAVQVKRVGGLNWYQITFADANSWIPGNIIQRQGSCGIN
ncbi:MAG: SH3 domain-containing protein [Anaerolineae bacterium]|nr:SH3 domain-containing protein [Anaerolineae bacterium]